MNNDPHRILPPRPGQAGKGCGRTAFNSAILLRGFADYRWGLSWPLEYDAMSMFDQWRYERGRLMGAEICAAGLDGMPAKPSLRLVYRRLKEARRLGAIEVSGHASSRQTR